ncbi:MAG: hypothetical protein ACLQJ7_16870 [Syntrophobacteraceae bacterium]
MEICKHRSSGKYFIYVDDVDKDKARFVTPKGEIKSYELDSFEQVEDLPEGNLLANGMITKDQIEKLHQYEEIKKMVRKKPVDQPPPFAKISTVLNAVDSLETSASFLARQDEFKWKWIAIALHHALYMFCVAALHNGNSDNVTTICSNPDANRWCIGDDQKWKKSTTVKVGFGPAYRIEWLPTEDSPPEYKAQKNKNKQPKLVGFWTALARVQDQHYWMGRLTITKALELTDGEIDDIVFLSTALRNEFVHYIPKGYLVDIPSIIKVSKTSLRAIEFLALRSNAVWECIEHNWRVRVQCAIKKVSHSLDQLSQSIDPA